MTYFVKRHPKLSFAWKDIIRKLLFIHQRSLNYSILEGRYIFFNFCQIKVVHSFLKFRYSERATKFCKISTLDLMFTTSPKSSLQNWVDKQSWLFWYWNQFSLGLATVWPEPIWIKVNGWWQIHTKGQLISKCPFSVIVSTKIPTNFY